MSSSLRVNTIVPSSGNNVAIGTAGGSVLFTVNSFDVTTSLIPPGAVQFFARNTAPDGWIKANGANISRSTYSSLFAGIGTAFGAGDGSTTFGLPDMRGEFPRGWDDGRGVDIGRIIGTFQNFATGPHDHRIDVNRNLLYSGGGGRANDAPGTNDFYDGTGGQDRTSNPIGGNVAEETRPRNIALLACIKY